MTSLASGSRFPDLDQPVFWQKYRSASNTSIANLLGCHVQTVRAARRRNGVAALPAGRARGGVTSVPRVDLRAKPTAMLIVSRYAKEAQPGGPAPTREYLWARMRAAMQADAAGDDDAFDDSLLGLASAAALVYDQRQKVRRAA